MIKELLSKIKAFYFPNKIEALKMKLALSQTSITSVFASIAATVTDDNSQPLAGQPVTYTAGGQTATGFTDETGVLVITVIAPVSSLTASLSDGITVASIDVVYPLPVALTTSNETVVQPAVTSELDKFKTRVAAIVAFVEHGVEVFGKDAEAELLAFKDKYL